MALLPPTYVVRAAKLLSQFNGASVLPTLRTATDHVPTHRLKSARVHRVVGAGKTV